MVMLLCLTSLLALSGKERKEWGVTLSKKSLSISPLMASTRVRLPGSAGATTSADRAQSVWGRTSHLTAAELPPAVGSWAWRGRTTGRGAESGGRAGAGPEAEEGGRWEPADRAWEEGEWTAGLLERRREFGASLANGPPAGLGWLASNEFRLARPES